MVKSLVQPGRDLKTTKTGQNGGDDNKDCKGSQWTTENKI